MLGLQNNSVWNLDLSILIENFDFRIPLVACISPGNALSTTERSIERVKRMNRIAHATRTAVMRIVWSARWQIVKAHNLWSID